MIPTDDNGRAELAAGDHFIEGKAQTVTVAESDPADSGGQALK